MNQPLPTGGFKLVNDVTPDEIAKRDNKGYLLEVDVKYPDELHDSHNELPFMCEKMKINKVEKLVPNLQVILAGTLTGVQGDIRCKVLAALSTAK